MSSSSSKPSSNKLTTWELLFIFIGFISIVTLIISVYVSYTRDAFYPPWGPVAYGGPWNIPTRYPIRGWGWDIRGYPAPYPIDYGLNGYPGGQPAYPAPQPDGANSGTAIGTNTKSDSAAPFGIQMTAKPTTTKSSTNKSQSNNQSQNEKQVELGEERTAEELYQRESRWWPDWVSWPWMPYFNYGLHYDVNGKLKPSNNDSIPANHTWSLW